jgi:hypothetical protein
MCLKTHVADETKTTTMQFLLEQCLNYIYQVNLTYYPLQKSFTFSLTGQQHVFQGINSFKIAVPFPKFHSILVASTTMQFLLEQCLNYIYQVQFH